MKNTLFATLGALALFTSEDAGAQFMPPPQNIQGAWIVRSPEGGAVARLNWDTVTNAIGYRIYRYNEPNNWWDFLATIPATNFFYDPTIGTGVTYYSMEAFSHLGVGSMSSTITVQSGDGGWFNVDFPGQYSSESLTPTNALVVWHIPTFDGADGMLEWGLSPTNLAVVGFNPGYLMDHGYAVSNLTPATVYYYRITSVRPNRAGLSELHSLLTPGSNHPPVAADVTLGLPSEYGMNIALACTDEDDPPSPLYSGFDFTVTVPPTNGFLDALVISAPPLANQVHVYYTPNPGARGDDHFQYTANDGQLDSAPATVTITNIFLNRWPEATSLTTNAFEDVPLDLVLGATDADGDPLAFTVDFVMNGTVSGTPPNLTYTSPADYYGEDYIFFSVTDGYGEPMSGVITITIDPVNDVPVPVVESVEVTTPEDVLAYAVVEATDTDYDSLTYIVTQPPAHGTLEDNGSGPVFQYNPTANYFGADSFVVVASDGQSTSAPVTVNLTIEPINDAPTAVAAAYSLAEDGSVNITLTGADVENNPLTFPFVEGPWHGTLSGTPPNLIYTPEADFAGDDYFAFVSNDGVDASDPVAVTINITPVNDAPIAQSQSLTTSYNAPQAFTLTGSDVEGSTLSFTVLTPPANGTLSGTAPNLTFTPNIGFTGAVSLTFRVNDGSLNSSPATVGITVQSPASVPPAPTGLTATAVSSSQINLVWTDNSSLEDGFKIERSLNGGSWTQIATVGRNVTGFASTGLAANKTYSYRIRAYNILGNSPYSNTASAKTFK